MVDWSRIRFATSTDDSPTPFYVLKELVDDVESHPTETGAVISYLMCCLKSQNPHVKLKSLLVIKQIASKVDAFRKGIRITGLHIISSLASLPASLDRVSGFEGNSLLRKAADDVIATLSIEDSHLQVERARIEDRIQGYGTHPTNSGQSSALAVVTSGATFLIDTVQEISTDVRVKGPGVTLKEATLDVADMVTEGLEIVTSWMRKSINSQDVIFPENYRQQSGNQFASFLTPPDLLN